MVFGNIFKKKVGDIHPEILKAKREIIKINRVIKARENKETEPRKRITNWKTLLR